MNRHSRKTASTKELPKELAKELTNAQTNALAEARARRAAHVVERRAAESGGQDGPEPTRYGDWEKDGIISDF